MTQNEALQLKRGDILYAGNRTIETARFMRLRPFATGEGNLLEIRRGSEREVSVCSVEMFETSERAVKIKQYNDIYIAIEYKNREAAKLLQGSMELLEEYRVLQKELWPDGFITNS